MSIDMAEAIASDFVQNSWSCIEKIVKELTKFKTEEKLKQRAFHFRNEKGNETAWDNRHFFLRASVEYSSPQVTLEEVQGIIAARLLEVGGNYFGEYGLRKAEGKDVDEICERLKKSPGGTAVSFLLNTDDVEPDRYSANPLKESIVTSGQSAFPAASVKTDDLRIDYDFVGKYNGMLISKAEVDLIARHLEASNNRYVDMVDAVKYEQLRSLSEFFGINLCIDSMRMPLEILERESREGLLHHIISRVHADYTSVEKAYNWMGRSIRSRTTLLTVAHSKQGYGSKRAARGKIYFDDKKLKAVHVDYRPTKLYDNEIDPNDISIAKADDSFTVEGEKLTDYDFKETPSSPQFSMYALASPENAAVWHGIGVFGPPQLLRSYTTVRQACGRDSLFENLKEKYSVSPRVPLSFNLVPSHMWKHPAHRNIDASVGSVADLRDLTRMGMRAEYLSNL